MADYETQCAWCHQDLDGGHLDGPPAFGTPVWQIAPEAHRYCSARCLQARIGELFMRTRDPREKWVRYSVEVPPEIAQLIDDVSKQRLGINATAYTRANVTRRALRELLDRILEIPEPTVDATAVDAPEELTV